MPLIVNPDFSEAYKPIQPGTYPCRIQAAELKTSEKTGNKYVSWELALDPSGKFKFFYNTPISGRGAGMLKEFIHAAGDNQYQAGPYNIENIFGHTVTCEIENETYINSQGQERSRVKVKKVMQAGREKPINEYKTSPSSHNEADLSF